MPLSIRRKLCLGFGAVIFVNGIIALLSITRLSLLTSVGINLVEEEIQEVHLLWTIRNLVHDMERDVQRQFLGGEQQKPLQQISHKQTKVSESISAYQQFHPAPSKEMERVLSDFTKAHLALQHATAKLIMPAGRGEDINAIASALESWKDLQRQALVTLDRLFAYEDRAATKTAALVRAQNDSSRIMILALSFMSILLSIVVTVVVTNSVTSPIERLLEATKRVTKGDFTVKAEIVSADEV